MLIRLVGNGKGNANANKNNKRTPAGTRLARFVVVDGDVNFGDDAQA